MARLMKDSGIPWIGEIPESWKTYRHKYVMHKEKTLCEHYNGEDIISLTMNGVIIRDLTAGGKMPTTFDGYQYVEPDDLLLCLFDIDVTPRCVGLVKDFGLTSPAYSRFKVHDGFFNAYYDYLLRTIDDKKVFVHLSKNLRSSLTESDFGVLPTIAPPYEEQKLIVSFLDAECARIDAVIEQTRASIEEYKKLKQSVITQAVTKGIRPNRSMKDSGIDWIGRIPADWEMNKVKFVSEFQPYCDISTLTEDTEITYTPMEFIKNGYYVKNTALLGKVATSLTPYAEGDIVIAKVTPCFENGNIAIMDKLSSGFGMGSSELFVLRAKAVCTKYLFYWLQNTAFMQRACATMTGTGGLKRVSPYFVKNCPITMPQIDEQHEIIEYLDLQTAKIESLTKTKEKYLSDLESYKKSLIFEYVTGKKEA